MKTARTFLPAIICIMLIASCRDAARSWEYKIVSGSEMGAPNLKELQSMAMSSLLGSFTDLDTPDHTELVDGYNRAIADALNELGAEGWELVFIDGTQFVFKRPQ